MGVHPRHVPIFEFKRVDEVSGDCAIVDDNAAGGSAAIVPASPATRSTASRVRRRAVHVVMLCCADTHCAALDANGKVWTWGAAAALGRRCRPLPAQTSAVKKESRGGASVYVVPYYLPPQVRCSLPPVASIHLIVSLLLVSHSPVAPHFHRSCRHGTPLLGVLSGCSGTRLGLPPVCALERDSLL